MATATAGKKSPAKLARKKAPAKATPPATNGHVLTDADLITLKDNLLSDPDARGAFGDELALRNVVETLVAKRNELDLSATEVAKRIGTSQPQMSQFELGKTHPTVRMCQAYARAVGMHLEIRLV